MRNRLITAAVATALAIPALALAADTATYSGRGDDDNHVKVSFKVADTGGDKVIKQVTLKGLPYSGGLCTGSGRTPELKAKGPFNVKDGGKIRIVGSASNGDPLQAGELHVNGKLTGGKITGDMKFRYGKDGCTTEKESFTARS